MSTYQTFFENYRNEIESGSLLETNLISALDFLTSGNSLLGESLIARSSLSTQTKQAFIAYGKNILQEKQNGNTLSNLEQVSQMVAISPIPELENTNFLKELPQELSQEEVENIKKSETSNEAILNSLINESPKEELLENQEELFDTIHTLEKSVSRQEEAYRRVFLNPHQFSNNENTKELNLIHTYEEDAATSQKILSAQEKLELEKGEKMFQSAKQYAQRAMDMNIDSVIVAATRQLDRLIEKYPNYGVAYPEKIQSIRAILSGKSQQIQEKTNEEVISQIQETQEFLDSFESQDITFVKGMSVSGEKNIYTLSTIIKKVQEITIVFVNKENKEFHIPISAMVSALHDEETQPDIFFAKYQ
jgi:hypothetical protein